MGAVNKDSVLGASLILSLVSLVLLFGVTCYFQTSLAILQQQVLELQEQATAAKSQDESRIQNVVRRQTIDGGCQCKDGLPGPRGPEGRKGEQGNPGQKGDVGEVGARGPIGDQGFPGMKGRAGEKGNQGDQGFPGPRGVLGLKGMQGSSGQKGDPGVNGSPGLKGDNGTKGDKGDAGEKGSTSEKGEKGSPGEVGSPGQQGSRGRRGEKGDPGEQGLPGEKGDTGSQGPQGPKGDVGNAVDIGPGETSRGKSQLPDNFDVTSIGSVYIRWGNNECPDTATLVYGGIAGGALYKDKGTGVNPQCLPWNPTYRSSVSGRDDTYSSRIYGGEYQLHGQLGRASHQSDVPCAVCHTNRSAQFMLPAQYDCPIGWTHEYDGYLMSARHDYFRTEYTCVDGAFKPVPNSSQNRDGLLFYPVQGRCGTLPCPSYDETKDLTCAVCTK